MFLISPTTENTSRFLLLHINTNEKLNYKINVREKQQSFNSLHVAYFNTVFEIHSSYFGRPHPGLVVCRGGKLVPHLGKTIIPGPPYPWGQRDCVTVTGNA